MLKKYKYIIVLVMLLVISTLAQTTLKVGNVYPGEVEMGGFNLSEDCTITIEGQGASFEKWESFLCYYAWILKTDSREIVWRSQNAEDFEKSEGEYDFDTELNLKAGDYEVYFAAGREIDKIFVDGLAMLEGIFDGKRSNISNFEKEYYVEISNEDDALTLVDPEELVDNRNDAIVTFIRVGDSENLRKGFSLSADTKVNVFAIGEGVKSEYYDFGYIYDVINNKKVWMFNRSDAHHAGGGRKNIEQTAEITLPKGSYEVYYKSDDSHSFDEWNVLPPNDPQYWGIVVSVADKADKKNVIPFRKNDITKPLVDLTRVESDELVSQGFNVTKNTKLRIICVGEGRKKMADYGWIENADTRDVIWKMNFRSSQYAGGSSKNRISDETIEFNAGNYVAYFITDDSHNFSDWNDTPPFEEDKWGISIWPTNEHSKNYVKLFNTNNYRSKNLISEITKVSDSENLRRIFKLNKTTNVRVIAIGEGSGKELVDYAWIADKNNSTVWKMVYEETSYAGGAKKNRIYDSVISLKAGEYILHYTTDDSHSFCDWNAPPPYKSQMYGVTLLYAK